MAPPHNLELMLQQSLERILSKKLPINKAMVKTVQLWNTLAELYRIEYGPFCIFVVQHSVIPLPEIQNHQ